MDEFKRIADLTKDELLSLIYNNIKTTVYEDQPCLCASCGQRSEREVVLSTMKSIRDYPNNVKAKVIYYICDDCSRK